MPYSPYRGPRRSRRGKIFFIAAFIMLGLIVATVVFFAAQEFVVFTAEGFRFEFPFGAGGTDRPTEPQDPTEPVNVIIEDTTAPPPPDTTAATQPPASSAPSDTRYIKPLTAAKMTSITGFAGWSQELPPALVVKDYDGVWHIPPQGEQSVLESLASLGSPAVFSAMRDAVGPRNDRSLAVTTTGGATWLDFNYISWYNPYAASDVLLEAVRVCAQAGVSELVFTNLQFPTRGRLEFITYGEGDTPEARIAAITALVAPLREYLTEQQSQMYLSIVLTEGCAEQFSDGDGGQDLLELARLADILYVPTSDPDFDVNPLLDAIRGTGCRIGLWFSGNEWPERQIDYISVG